MRKSNQIIILLMVLYSFSTFAQVPMTISEQNVKKNSSQHRLLNFSTSSSIQFSETFVENLGAYFCENNITTGDFDNDGYIDILLNVTTKGIITFWKSKLLLLRNNGKNIFSTIQIDSTSGYGYKVFAADFNNDGKLDFVACSDIGMSVYLNNGNSTFTKIWSDTGWGCGGLFCADINLDGSIDIVRGFQGTSGGYVKTFLNDGNGHFTLNWTSQLYGSAYGTISEVIVSRITSDSYPDIVAVEIYSGNVIVLKNNGTNSNFVETWRHNFGARVFGLSRIFFKSDSLASILLNVGHSTTYLFEALGDSLNEHWQSINYGSTSFNVGSGDFDGDILPDAFVGTLNGPMYIFHNVNRDSLSLIWSDTSLNGGYSGFVADINKDSLSDLIVGEGKSTADYFNTTTLTSVNNSMNQKMPNGFWLSQNYPNPFNPTTIINYSIPQTSFVTIKVYDVLGHEITTLVNGEKPAGNYEVKFSVETRRGESLPSGIYFYSLQAGSYYAVKKLVVLK
ncbi:MAG: T9SS type A sorting domain-containing protein [Bacteroidetes bacterium]|nr:T9SS type A sorting domain-containing protein [Bacteroidota bacterium]